MFSSIRKKMSLLNNEYEGEGDTFVEPYMQCRTDRE